MRENKKTIQGYPNKPYNWVSNLDLCGGRYGEAPSKLGVIAPNSPEEETEVERVEKM